MPTSINGQLFNNSTVKFDPVNAHVLGQLAALSYRNSTDATKLLQDWGLPSVEFVDVDQTQGFVAANDAVVFVAFRGTEPHVLQDWVTDIRAELVKGPAGHVHAGFERALSSAWAPLNKAISAYRNRGQSLWFTGHSRGGALATLAAARFRLVHDTPVFGVYTFGQPRVGDREFEFRFNADLARQTFRFVNNNDVVPRVPPRLVGYSHVGTVLHFDSQRVLTDDRGARFRLLDAVEGRIADLGIPGSDGIKDHSMTGGYLPGLARLQNPFA